MGEAIKAIAQALIDNRHVLVLLFGFILFVYSLIGGIRYAEIIAPIDDPIYRHIGLVAGGLLMVAGTLLRPTNSTATVPKASKYGIKITSPSDGDNVPGEVTVRLEVKKPPPQGYDLRIFRKYARSGHLYPTSLAQPTNQGKVWRADRCTLGGKTNEEILIAAFLVGPSGKSLVQYFHTAGDTHRKTLEQLRQAVPNAEAGEDLPNIRTPTKDMVECDAVKVRRM